MQQRALVLLLALLPAIGNGSAANRAGVVIRYADGTVRSMCVGFQEESLSGLELLQRAEADVIAQAAPGNAAVCKIGADGCDYPAQPCFCKFGAGNSGEYWAYWQLDGTAWRYGQQGAGARRVSDGDVDGWAYGSGTVENGVQPPPASFAEVCPLAAASPAAVASLPAVASLSAPEVSDDASPLAASAPPLSSAPVPSPQPSAAGAAQPAQPGAAQPSTDWGSYLVFGAMLAAVLGGVAVALRRRGAA